ncbi:MAG TPA: hypothetical protein PLU88_05320 [Armatimonadota bacterium]|nr:hypothetical protein [Armatimonadota bacterium]HPP74527.1 hypothetical protein [Armatimonadota bacterium]
MLSANELAQGQSFNDVIALGSYWSRTDDVDLQSQLVKCFKNPESFSVDKLCLEAITKAYSGMIVQASQAWQPNAIIRVLSSGETKPDPAKPHSALASLISSAFNVPDLTSIFFKTETRKPMRMIDQLSGNEVLRHRINYVLQDLFLVPRQINGTVLLIDDIYNLGATARVYAAVLKRLCGVDKVYSINIAAARFSGGKDGWGKLVLDLDRFLNIARCYIQQHGGGDSFDDAWIVRNQAEYHLKQDCLRLDGKGHRSLVFLARRERVPCPSCISSEPKRTLRNWLLNRFSS